MGNRVDYSVRRRGGEEEKREQFYIINEPSCRAFCSVEREKFMYVCSKVQAEGGRIHATISTFFLRASRSSLIKHSNIFTVYRAVISNSLNYDIQQSLHLTLCARDLTSH